MIDPVEQGDNGGAKQLFGSRSQKVWGKIRKSLQPLIRVERAAIGDTRESVSRQVDATLNSILALGLGSVLLGLVVA